MIYIILLLIIWYWISQKLAEWFLNGGWELSEDEIWTIRAGMLMLPGIVPMILLAYAMWHLVHFWNYWQIPGVGPAKENPMEYLL